MTDRFTHVQFHHDMDEWMERNVPRIDLTAYLNLIDDTNAMEFEPMTDISPRDFMIVFVDSDCYLDRILEATEAVSDMIDDWDDPDDEGVRKPDNVSPSSIYKITNLSYDDDNYRWYGDWELLTQWNLDTDAPSNAPNFDTDDVDVHDPIIDGYVAMKPTVNEFIDFMTTRDTMFAGYHGTQIEFSTKQGAMRFFVENQKVVGKAA